MSDAYSTSQKITVNSATGSISVVNAGPPGPSIIPPNGTDGQVLGKIGGSVGWLNVGTSEEVDQKIEAHNQNATPHTNATSGRDYAALFQNGLI